MRILYRALIAAAIIIVVFSFLFAINSWVQSKAIFTIVEDSYEPHVGYDSNLNAYYNYTIYVKVKNTGGASGSKVIWCELTFTDLTTTTNQNHVLSLDAEQQQVISFAFSYLSKQPKEYRCWIG